MAHSYEIIKALFQAMFNGTRNSYLKINFIYMYVYMIVSPIYFLKCYHSEEKKEQTTKY